jgi:hypothetical protein
MMQRTTLRAIVTVALLGLPLCAPRIAGAQAPDFTRMTPEERTAYMSRLRAAADSDRATMMAVLGLHEPSGLPAPAVDPGRPSGLTQRPGSDSWFDAAGNTYVRSAWGNWSNYDEVRAGAATSPDPLVLNDGTRVTDAGTWWTRRRPEILAAFSDEIYGRIPPRTPAVAFSVASIDSAAYPGAAIVKRIVGHVDNSGYPAAAPSVDVTMYTAPDAPLHAPVVVMVGGFFGRPSAKLPDAVAQVLALGWAVATVHTGNVQADNGAGLSAGIIGLVNEGRPRTPADWGVLAAWSWGLSRALDYLATDPAVDARRAAVQGHSRWGKTALLAGALDERWAIVYASCSGAMGASLEQRAWGETIDNVAGSGEYHWMAGNFLKYAGHWNDMPVDAHELIALVAPRPLFITGGTRDQWSDPHGEFLAAVGADPVYRLLGARGLGTTIMPEPDSTLMSGELAFRDHEGGHTDAPDWPVFLRFARRYFDREGTGAR